jgi:hypothetical protein
MTTDFCNRLQAILKKKLKCGAESGPLSIFVV